MKLDSHTKELALFGVVITLFIFLNFSLFSNAGFSWDTQRLGEVGSLALEKGVHEPYVQNIAELPPLNIYFLTFDSWLALKFFGDNTPQSSGYLFIGKLIPFLCNLIIGVTLFLYARKKSYKTAIWTMVLYFLSLALIYATSYWGQTDSIQTFFIFFSLLFLLDKRYLLSSLSITLAVMEKVQSISIAPVIFFVILIDCDLKTLGKIFLANLILIILLLTPFLFSGTTSYVVQTVLHSVDHYPYLTINAYNFWYLISPHANFSDGLADSTKFLGLSFKSIGLILVLAYLLFVLYTIFKAKTRENIIIGSSLMALAFFILPTQIHERYLFPFFALFALIAFEKREYFWTYLILSLTFLLNLLIVLPFSGRNIIFTLFQDFLTTLTDTFSVSGVGIALSLINVGVFVYLSWIWLVSQDYFKHISKKKEKSWWKNKDLWIIGFLLLLCLIIIWNNLGASSYYDWDETRHADNALEMLKTGDWIVPKFDHVPDMWNLKPPFGAWLIALSFKIFGFTAFALRFWSAVFGTGSVLLIYLFGRDLGKSRLIGLVASLFSLTINTFTGFHAARTGDYDAFVLFFIILSLYLFYRYEQNKKHIFLLYSMAVSIALGVLTKWVIGLFPVIIILLYLAIKGKVNEYLSKKTFYTILIFLVVTLPWFILRALKGDGAISKMISYDLIKRGTESIENHPGDWSYYLGVCARDMGFVFVLAELAFAFYLYRISKKDYKYLLVFSWVSVVFVLFTLAKTKIEWYIVPAYPALCLLIAFFIFDMEKKFKLERWITFLIIALLLVFPLANNIAMTNNPYFESDVNSYKEMIPYLQNVGNIYVYSVYEGNKGDNRQSLLFSLNSVIKGETIGYDNITTVNPKQGEYIITVKPDFVSVLDNRTDLETVTVNGNAHLYRKI